MADQNLPNQSPGISVPSNSPNSSTNSSTTISGFLIDEEIVLKESSNQSEDISPPLESSSRASFSCNGTSELPLHIQDVRERVKRELGNESVNVDKRAAICHRKVSREHRHISQRER